jgi:hypothetical protein
MQQGIGLRVADFLTIVGTAGYVAGDDFIIITPTQARIHTGSTLPDKGWNNVTKQKV